MAGRGMTTLTRGELAEEAMDIIERILCVIDRLPGYTNEILGAGLFHDVEAFVEECKKVIREEKKQ